MENDYGLVELVELLRSIDENAESAQENEFVIYDMVGNKILL